MSLQMWLGEKASHLRRRESEAQQWAPMRTQAGMVGRLAGSPVCHHSTALSPVQDQDQHHCSGTQESATEWQDPHPNQPPHHITSQPEFSWVPAAGLHSLPPRGSAYLPAVFACWLGPEHS